MIRRNRVLLLPIFALLLSGSLFSSASATPPAKILSGILSNTASALFKWLWSLKPAAEICTAIPSRSMVKFEGGYTVETVFDGSKLGIEPHAVEVTPSGELLVLDSENSNVHRIPTPLSRYSRPKILTGSSEGYHGHVDGKPREARLNHPRGLTVDNRGNIYVADAMNMAIRKISDAGVVTIAGGNRARGTGHIDGPSDNAKFSDDFDVTYVASSCSILVVDRGNQAIREIQLHDEDCVPSPHDDDLHLGIAVLGAAVFFGFMLALLQRRLTTMFSSHNDSGPPMNDFPPVPYQRPPLIPAENEQETQDEGAFCSLGKLLINPCSAVSGTFKKTPLSPHLHANYPQHPPFSDRPVQESFMVPDDNTPRSLETRDPHTRKSYPFTTKDPEKPRHFKQTRYAYKTQNNTYSQQQCQEHYQRHCSTSPRTYYDETNEKTDEVVFGVVQEQDGERGTVAIRAVDYSNSRSRYGNESFRTRYNYGISSAYGMY